MSPPALHFKSYITGQHSGPYACSIPTRRIYPLPFVYKMFCALSFVLFWSRSLANAESLSSFSIAPASASSLTATLVSTPLPLPTLDRAQHDPFANSSVEGTYQSFTCINQVGNMRPAGTANTSQIPFQGIIRSLNNGSACISVDTSMMTLDTLPCIRTNVTGWVRNAFDIRFSGAILGYNPNIMHVGLDAVVDHRCDGVNVSGFIDPPPAVSCASGGLAAGPRSNQSSSTQASIVSTSSSMASSSSSGSTQTSVAAGTTPAIASTKSAAVVR